MADRPISMRPSSPLPSLLLLLSATTGLVDAVSVLGLGKVFTANMTGNVVFLGFAAAQAPGFVAAPYLVALAAFFGGAALAGRLGRRFDGRPLRHWLTLAAVTEALLFWSAAAIATRFDLPTQSPSWAVLTIIALTAIAMGVRNATVRQLKVPDLTTTVLTLTITGLAADSRGAGGAVPNTGRRIGSVLAIFAGALIGALLVRYFGLALPLAITGGLVMAGTLAAALHPVMADPNRS